VASPGPMYYPPPPRQRSLVGPLLLIIIGVLFLMKNFGYSLSFLNGFVRYWPVLLVAVGAIRLAEYFWARSNDRAAPQMGGLTVFFLIVVAIAGIAVSAAYHSHKDINWGTFRDNIGDEGIVHLFGNEYSFDGESKQEIPAGGVVRVRCERGNITISRWDGPEVKVVYHKRIFAGSQGEANSTNQATNPRVQLQGTALEIDANTEGAGPRGVASDLEVFAPEKTGVEITSRHGDTFVTQRSGDVKIDSQHGDVSLDQVSGNVRLSSHHGSLHATNVNGNLTVDGRLDDLSLDSIAGAVLVTADIFGDTKLSRLQKGAAIRTSRTELQLARLDGDLTMDSGDLQGDGLIGPVSLSTKAKDIELKNLKGDVRVSDDHGDINYENASVTALGNIDLTTHHGDVHVKLSPKANFQYALSTRHGDISSEFEGVHSSGSTGASSASGTVGRGGPKVSVTSDTGDIALDKSEAAASEPPAPPAPPVPAKPARGKKPSDVEVM